MAAWYTFLRSCFFILILLGLAASFYAYYVEKSKEMDSNFKAACDLSPTMSCSKVFTSRYGKGFGLLEFVVGKDHILNQPNSVFGVAFYVIQAVLGLSHSASKAKYQIYLSVLANCGSVYLAYILYFILHDFCIVCVSTYAINFTLLLVCIGKYRYLTSLVDRKRRKKQQ